MKYSISRILTVSLLSILLVAGASQKSNAQDITVSYQSFYDNLAPYGQWIYDPEYGNVWVPNEDGDFRPYGSRGHWVMTEYGNTWISEDPWGWAVYHYGRWSYNPYYGWVWVPGYEWAPAWVNWRFGGGYAGWAPMGPGMNIGSNYYAPDSWWVFVGPQYMYQPNCIRYWSGPSYNPGYIRQTTIINNYYVDNSTRVRYNYGPRAEVIQQFTRRPVQVYQVSHLNRPGAPSVGRSSVSLYRPSVNRSSVRDARPERVMQAPRSVGRGEQIPQGGGNRTPAFRQESQRNQPGRDAGRQTNQDGYNRGNRTDQSDQQGRSGRTDNGRIERNQPDQPNRVDQRNNTRQPERSEPRNDTRQQPRQEPRTETRSQPTRNEPRPESRPQPTRNEPRREPSPQPTRNEPRSQPTRTETRPQPGRTDTRPQTQPGRSQPTPTGGDTRQGGRR